MSPLQIFYHLGMSWDLRWTTSSCERIKFFLEKQKVFSEPVIPTTNQVSCYQPCFRDEWNASICLLFYKSTLFFCFVVLFFYSVDDVGSSERPLFLNHRNCIAFNRLFNSSYILMYTFVATYFLDPFLNCNSDMSDGSEVFAE